MNKEQQEPANLETMKSVIVVCALAFAEAAVLIRLHAINKTNNKTDGAVKRVKAM